MAGQSAVDSSAERSCWGCHDPREVSHINWTDFRGPHRAAAQREETRIGSYTQIPHDGVFRGTSWGMEWPYGTRQVQGWTKLGG